MPRNPGNRCKITVFVDVYKLFRFTAQRLSSRLNFCDVFCFDVLIPTRTPHETARGTHDSLGGVGEVISSEPCRSKLTS